MINDGTAGGRTHSTSGRSRSALFHRFGLALAVSVAIAAFALATHGEALTFLGVASRALLFAGPLTVIYSILGRVLSHRLAHAFGDLGWTSWLWSAAAAIVGAGVYGLGSAAHALQSHGVNAEIFSHGIVDGAAALTLLLPILCLGAVIRTTWVSECKD